MAQIRGIVIKSTGSWYSVESLANGTMYDCRIRGKLRLKGMRTTNPVTVGDIVQLDVETPETAVITAIEPRKNYIIRRSTNLSKESHILAANIDTLFLVVALDFPATSTEFIDRYLLTAEMYKVPAVILLNKIDLFSDIEFKPIIDDFHAIYEAAGYKVIDISATQGVGIENVRALMQQKTTLFSGNSGVGKSTLINALYPHIEAKTGDISASHNKGKHTTTFCEMYKLPEGGYMIDSPGIKGFGLVDISPEEITHYMPDLFALQSECRFYNCTHAHEPGCAVKAAVEAGSLSEERYTSYLKILEGDDKYR